MPLEPANPAPQPINKKELSERDICSKFITPALVGATFLLATAEARKTATTK